MSTNRWPKYVPAQDHTARRAVLEPGLPAAGVLGPQVGIPAHEPGGVVLEETRLLESGADRGERPDALGEPGGGARAIGQVRAEALIVLEPGAESSGLPVARGSETACR